MLETSQVFANHWLSRIDEYRHTPIVCFGIGALSKVDELAKGIAKNSDVIIVTDKIISEMGLTNLAKKSLERAGFNVTVYECIEKEPLIEEAKQMIDTMRRQNYGLVVGIGGGSAMDKAKMLAAMLETPGELEEYVAPSTKPLNGARPKILIPTTSGTGSECSNTAVVIVPDKDIGSMKTWITGNEVLAEAAIIDPSLTVELPQRVTAGTGMDALSHTAEAVLSLQANPFSDAIALQAVALVSQSLSAAYHQGSNIEARWNMALAAAIGGMVISYPWVSGPGTLAHVASEGISARYSIPHGEACGVLLPFVYWYNMPSPYARTKLAKIASAMGEDVSQADTRAAAQKAITATFDLLEDIDLPTSLKDYNLPKKDIPMIAEYILARAENMYSMSEFNPRKATLKNLQEFFEIAYEGREALHL